LVWRDIDSDVVDLLGTPAGVRVPAFRAVGVEAFISEALDKIQGCRPC
jgi:hypothetical protein